MEAKRTAEKPRSEGRLHDLIDHEFRKNKLEFGTERPLVDESGKINNTGREAAMRIFTNVFGDSSDVLYSPMMLQCTTLERQFRDNHDQKSQTIVALVRSIRSRIVCSATADFVAQNHELLPQNAAQGLELLEANTDLAQSVTNISEKKSNFRRLFKQRRQILGLIAESRTKEFRSKEQPILIENFYEVVDREKDELRRRLREERHALERENLALMQVDLQTSESDQNTKQTEQIESPQDNQKWLLKVQKLSDQMRNILTSRTVHRVVAVAGIFATFVYLGAALIQPAKASSNHHARERSSHPASHITRQEAFPQVDTHVATGGLTDNSQSDLDQGLAKPNLDIAQPREKSDTSSQKAEFQLVDNKIAPEAQLLEVNLDKHEDTKIIQIAADIGKLINKFQDQTEEQIGVRKDAQGFTSFLTRRMSEMGYQDTLNSPSFQSALRGVERNYTLGEEIQCMGWLSLLHGSELRGKPINVTGVADGKNVNEQIKNSHLLEKNDWEEALGGIVFNPTKPAFEFWQGDTGYIFDGVDGHVFSVLATKIDTNGNKLTLITDANRSDKQDGKMVGDGMIRIRWYTLDQLKDRFGDFGKVRIIRPYESTFFTNHNGK